MTKPDKEGMISGLNYIKESTFKGTFNGVEDDGVLLSELIGTMTLGEDFTNAILNVLCDEYEKEMKEIISENSVTYTQINTDQSEHYKIKSSLIRKDKVLEFYYYVKMGMNDYQRIFDEAIKEVFKDGTN